MARKVSFQFNLIGGGAVLQVMAMSAVRKSANAIADRARSNASTMTSRPPNITVTSSVGVIKRGSRAIAKVSGGGSQRDNYIAAQSIRKAKDAGKLS